MYANLRKLLFVSFFLAASALKAYDSQGDISLILRQYTEDPKEETVDQSLAMQTKLSIAMEKWGKIAFYGRIDSKNSERNLIDLQELNARYFIGDILEVSGGQGIFDWSSMDVYKPGDAINSRDLDAELEGPIKLGEQFLETSLSLGDSTLSFFYFPKGRESNYPSSSSREGPGVDLSKHKFQGRKGHSTKQINQFAVRYQDTYDNLDLSLFYLDHLNRSHPLIGTDRHTVYLGKPIPIDPTEIKTVNYYMTKELGLNAAYSFEDFLLRIEMMDVKYQTNDTLYTGNLEIERPSDFQTWVIGAEYNIEHDNGLQSALTLEAQLVKGVSDIVKRRYHVSASDIYLNYRLDLNEVMGASFNFSSVLDWRHTSERMFIFRFERRLSDHWKYTIAARLIDAPHRETGARGLEVLERDHYGQLKLSRYF